jgi:hypothetical protein
MPKATLGRTVIVHNLMSNGANDHPAVITRAWSELPTEQGPVCVNLTVFPDCGAPLQRSCVLLFQDAEAARRHTFENAHAIVAHWPERD